MNPLKKFYFQTRYGLRCGPGCRVGWRSRSERPASLGRGNFFGGSIGRCSYVANHCHLTNVQIGRFCSIGSWVRVLAGYHPISTWVSTSPAFFSTLGQAGVSFCNKQEIEDFKFVPGSSSVMCKIGNDVWIGSCVSLVNGTVVGDGCVVLAGAVVTQSLEPYGIYGGVPAKRLRDRFEPEEMEYLLKLRWWEKDLSWIQQNACNFRDIKGMMKNVSP